MTADRLHTLVLPRPRLETVLDGVLAHRLALVVGDAGCGKTTLVGSWSQAINAAVHDVTPSDVELSRFARQVVSALRERVAGLSPDLLDGVEPERTATSGKQAQPDALAEFVGAALSAQVIRDTVLVLDNVHLIGDGPSTRFLAGLIRHAPPLLHLVLTSRAMPPIAVERLRGHGEVVELYGADLAFNLDEVNDLLVSILGSGSGGLAKAVHDTTGGWPAAVRLLVEALRAVEPDQRARHVTNLAGADTVSQLARAVYEQEPRESKHLLAVVALFDEVCADLLEAIGIDDTGSLVALTQRGLFLEPGASGVGWYRLHAIASETVAAYGGLSDGEAARARLAAADWFTANDLPHLALRALAAARRFDDVTALLVDTGQQLLSQGNADDVIEAVDCLPGHARDASVERLAGEAFQLQGQWDQALASYERAIPPAGTPDAGLAWRMGLIHYLRGDPSSALSVYEQARDESEPSRDRALLLAWSAAAHWGLGDAATCGRVAVEALRVATAVDDAHALAAAHTILGMLAALEGDPRANDAHYLKALQHAQRVGDLFQLVRIHTNRGSYLMEQGAYADALEELDRAIGLAELSGLAGFGALALNNRGEARLGLGRLEEAQADLETSAAILADLGSNMVAYPLHALGKVHHLRGDVVAARKALEKALHLAEAVGDVQGRVPALTGLARLLANEDPARAAELADDAVAAGPGLGVVGALLAAGWVALVNGDQATARRRARAAADVAEARRYRPGAAEARALQAAATDDDREALALAEEATSLWRDLDDPIGFAQASLVLADRLDRAAAAATLESVRTRMRSVGCRLLEARAAEALARLAPAATSTLRIETLGGFRVVRHDGVVPGSAWKSRKARDLLKILISRRGRAVTRERLMEILWADQTPAEIGNRLNVLLSTIRSVLDPERQLGPDGVVVADGDAIRLDLDVIEIDVEEFLAHADRGIRLLRDQREVDALEHLLRAEACYHGDFAEEDPYEDWATSLREEARATYREVAARLARHASESGDHDAAIRYLLRSLEHDPYDERSHLELVSALAASGRHGDARRQYRVYCARMDELGVEAAPFSTA